jgi:hypothetical protein
MITGIHTMFYSSQADELRAFLRDKLQLPYTDVGHGWLIFDAPEVELGCHPSSDEPGGTNGTHAISFYCDDIHQTVADLKTRGVEFTQAITDAGYGLTTSFKVPGDFTVDLYQPHYKKNSSAT